MPKKTKTGGGARRRAQTAAAARSRELLFAEPGQGYGVVVSICGSKRFRVVDTAGLERCAHLRGSIKRGERVGMGDLVLFSERNFQMDKIDVLQRYTPEEARKLAAVDEIPVSMAAQTDQAADQAADEDVVFDDAEINDI